MQKKWLRLTREAFDLDGRHARIRWLCRALGMPLSVIAHLPKVVLSPRLSGVGERLRGCATLIRLRMARMGWMLQQVMGRRI